MNLDPAVQVQALAVIRHQYDVINLYLEGQQQRQNARRMRRARNCWVRKWISRRPELGVYDRLLVELRAEDPSSFSNFLRMPPPMFDELLERLTQRLEKEQTFMMTPLSPGLKLALTLRHFASGHTYSAMKFSWRVPHNTISVVVREVCQAIIDEYLDELMTCPTTPQAWLEIAQKYLQRWNFPHTCGAMDGLWSHGWEASCVSLPPLHRIAVL
jgi:hypothetical protein